MMEETSLITTAMKEKIGKEVNIQITQISQRMVDQYLAATTDINPVWIDKGKAINAGYADTPVPEGLLTTMQMEGDSPTVQMPEQAHLKGAVDVGGEWEFYHPVYIGDVITVTRKLRGIKERTGKLGISVINTFEVTYRNQRSVVVAKGNWTTFRYATK